MRLAYFDCFNGISGDMAVGALLDAGADFAALETALRTLDLPGASVSAERVVKNGIAATQFKVHTDPNNIQPRRHLHHIETIVRSGGLPQAVTEDALATFRILGEAEAAVHGTSIERIHFHEVGAVDSIVDIVAAHYALHALGIERVCCSSLPMGHGMIRCAHGLMPIPAPATAKLLEGKPTYGGDAEGELVTPTSAALMVQSAFSFGAQPAMTVERIGYGAGTRDYSDRANALRVLIGEAKAAPQAPETIVTLEANIDDMNPELLPSLLDALLQSGARDAFLTPILGKKGRAAHCVTALCDETLVDAVSIAMFAHSTTLGLRMRREERIVLERAWKNILTPWGAVRVKLAFRAGIQTGAAPEFEDCRARAEAAGVPVRTVYEAAFAAAIRGEWNDG